MGVLLLLEEGGGETFLMSDGLGSDGGRVPMLKETFVFGLVWFFEIYIYIT